MSISLEGNLERDWNVNCSVGRLFRGRGVIAGIFSFFFLLIRFFDRGIGKTNWKRFSSMDLLVK